MSDGSAIEWTEATWNPMTGCTKVSQGCKNCYAERDWKRLSANPLQPAYHGRAFTDVRTHPERLQIPLRWTRGRRIFVNSMSDLFHEAVPFEFIDDVFAVMSVTTRHKYQVLTKRPARMLEYFARAMAHEGYFGGEVPDFIDATRVWPQWTPCRDGKPGYDTCGPVWPLKNVWLGVSVEDQATAHERIPYLLRAPARVRFLSIEPLLGPVDLANINTREGETWNALDREEGRDAIAEGGCGGTIDWVIAGGESGPHARPTHPGWVRSIRDQCAAYGVPFFFKQWGEYAPTAEAMPMRGHVWADGMSTVAVARVGKRNAGRTLDGRTHEEYPA